MWREYVRMALRAIAAHKFRSALTITSITVGAFSIVVMSSLASSGLETLAQGIEDLGGARIIMIAPKPPERARVDGSASVGLTRRDRDLLFSALRHTDAHTIYAAIGTQSVESDAGKSARTDIVAADEGFFDVLRLKVGKGRLFTKEENDGHAAVCVVGDGLAEELWGGDAVGRWLTTEKVRCRVVGQLAKIEHLDTNFGFEWLDFVALPFETSLDTRPALFSEAVVQMRTTDVAHNDDVKRIVNAVLSDRHRGVDDFQIWDFNAFMKQFHIIFLLMEVVVGLISGIALLVGGVGVMNMMLVSVSERTREIGVRRALGAKPRDISAQFLCESSLLASFGGVVGAATGVVAALLAQAAIVQSKPMWITGVSEGAVVVAVCVAWAIGIGFGFIPARRASRLAPVEAMRK